MLLRAVDRSRLTVADLTLLMGLNALARYAQAKRQRKRLCPSLTRRTLVQVTAGRHHGGT